ncbi:hypothetical protein [Kibdelosporangium persicum]|uniref:hypothetical protein n=1 Tax=Kibdelosporangium persicum TaxID=2698649 RepID=UPI001563624A|nr:hypothetical protein [Kibdelosporangium persicum]
MPVQLVCIASAAFVAVLAVTLTVCRNFATSHGRHRASNMDNAAEATEILEKASGQSANSEIGQLAVRTTAVEVDSTVPFRRPGDFAADADTDFYCAIDPALVRPYVESMPHDLHELGWFRTSGSVEKRIVALPSQRSSGDDSGAVRTSGPPSLFKTLPATESIGMAYAA